MKNILKISGVILLLLFFFSCNKTEPPALSTTAVTDITTNSAVSGGTITDNGGADVFERGICWNTSGNPGIQDNKFIASWDSVSLSFSGNLSGLAPNTLYYVRAYAANSAGTGFGNPESFTTLGEKPSATALDATNIETHSATLNGTVNPGLLQTTIDFEYGTTTGYGNTIASTQSPVSGDSAVSVTANVTGLNPGSIYHFRMKTVNEIAVTYSNDLIFVTPGKAPEAATEDYTSLKINTVTLNGSVTPNRLETAVSFEWGTTASYGDTICPSQNPGTGTSSVNVSASLTGLTPGTTYHYRIRAVNEMGTAYGDDMTFKTYVVADADNNYYYAVTIGTQTWMQENLKTTHYRDDTSIPLVTDNTSWKNLTTPGYCWYNNSETDYKSTCGALYNWYTVNTGKLCPSGWHVPANGEWITLTNYLGGESVAGGKLKETGSIHWGDLNSSTNETGFTALPGGYRKDDGTFADIGSAGLWWSASTALTSLSYYAVLFYNSSSLVRGSYSNTYGLSIRCIKD
jgi:uncharacterized protein (TIGR02145 family)